MANVEKDQRLYFTIPNDFHRHPKVKRLSDAAFRAFVEMLGEARIADNDGEFEADEAEFLWEPEVLESLVKSHPSRPLVIADQGGYRMREYAKHQQTKSEREERAQRARENGAKGGRPPKPRGKAKETQGVSGGLQSKPNSTQVKAQSESESELHDLLLTESVSLGSNGYENDLTDSEEDPEQVEACLRLAVGHGLNLPRIIELADHHCARRITHQQALVLGQHITGKSKNRLKNPMSYVTSTFKNSAAEVQQAIDRGMT